MTLDDVLSEAKALSVEWSEPVENILALAVLQSAIDIEALRQQRDAYRAGVTLGYLRANPTQGEGKALPEPILTHQGK